MKNKGKTRDGARGGKGAVAPSSGSVSPLSRKNFVSVGEFLTEN